MVSQYLDDPRGERVLDALDEIALTRGVSVAAVAIDWLRAKPGIVAPIASARTVEQLDGILPTFTLDPSEITKLDEASA